MVLHDALHYTFLSLISNNFGITVNPKYILFILGGTAFTAPSGNVESSAGVVF